MSIKVHSGRPGAAAHAARPAAPTDDLERPRYKSNPTSPRSRRRKEATELGRGILFHPVGARFKDLASCVDFARADLARLVDMVRRVESSQDNLFVTVTYDHSAWERVQQGLDRWGRC